MCVEIIFLDDSRHWHWHFFHGGGASPPNEKKQKNKANAKANANANANAWSHLKKLSPRTSVYLINFSQPFVDWSIGRLEDRRIGGWEP